jgi:copper resistance protein D
LPDLLVWMRAIHFAATISVAGAIFFVAFIGEPALRAANKVEDIAIVVRSRLAWIVSTSLVIVVLSWAAWLILQAQRMSDLPLASVLSEGTVWTVLAQTDFGQVWVARLVVAVLCAGALFLQASVRRDHSRWAQMLATLLVAGLVGSLAWAGHAAAGSDSESDLTASIHLPADVLHLIASAAWVGSLVPLAILIGSAVRHIDGPSSLPIARVAIARYSTLGVLSVGTLLATGIISSWALVGSAHALIHTDYGRLLLVKIALFLAMLSIAAVNRQRLTPRLMQNEVDISAQDALRQLQRNAIIEAAIGIAILFIVALLGTLPPGVDQDAS